jgi:uroporphyrinogen-III synthase
MSSILSTKILTAAQKELLLNANQSFVSYNAIEIEFLDFKIDGDTNYFVFTSQNGVRAFLNTGDKTRKPAFCVGEKTKLLLLGNGFKVEELAQNSFDLAEIIVKKYKTASFSIFSGNLRRPELTENLQKNNVWYKEYISYRTVLKYKKFDRVFNGVLFFSPSGVQSFTKENSLANSWAFCIGDTTAAEAKKHTKNIVIANKPTVENVLVQAIKHFYSRLYGKDKK